MKIPPTRHAERLTEERNPRTTQIDRVPIREALAMLHAEDRLCIEAVEAVAPQVEQAIELVVAAFRAGGRLFYVGAGTSGRLGVLDASEQPPTFGVEREMVQGIIAGGLEALVRSIEGAEDDPQAGARALNEHGVQLPDVVMGITTGGRAPFVIGALMHARKQGMKTILLTCTPPLDGEDDLADCQIHALVGPEAITGSTRMKAGTATKLILNQITTLAMVQLGKVYENLMVGMQTKNEKLVDRACRILVELTDLDAAAAAHRLAEADNDLKVALVMTLGECAKEAAIKKLDQNSGQVNSAIAAATSSDDRSP